ncbi:MULTISPECIES: MFS transporter [unclassified Curtobacterium]|uniref:MFS transporter n=1 Tax=unclassified Curtobacterium TaxID=257496 RepID=UPI003A7F6F7B
MKRSFSLRESVFVGSGLGLIAATYGLVRLAYGLFLPDVQRDLGLRADAAGWVSSGASALYCVGAVVGYRCAGRVPRVLVAVAAAVAGAGALGMAAAGAPAAFAIASVVGSAGAGLASPALVSLVTTLVPPPAQRRAQAVVNAGTGPGLVAAGVLALALLPDWRTAWTWSGIATLVVGAVLLASSWSPRRTGAGGRTRTERSPAAGPDPAWWRAHRAVLVLALLFGAGSAVVWTYGRSVLVDAGAPVAVSVSAWIALGVGGAAVVVTARWTSRLRARTQWALTGVAVALGVLALGTVPQWTPVALVACAVFGWGYTAATGALIAWTTEIDPERSSAGTAVLFVALVLGQAGGAAAAGAVVEPLGSPGTFGAGALVTAVCAVLGARVRAAGAARSSGRTPPTPPVRPAARPRRPAGP